MVVDVLAEELVFADGSTMTRKNTLKAKDKEPTANFTIFMKPASVRCAPSCIDCTIAANRS